MSNENVYDEDMYDFLVDKNYIQTGIAKDMYVSFFMEHQYIINYKGRYTTKFVQKSLSGLFSRHFPTGYLDEIRTRSHPGNYEIPETNPLNFKIVNGQMVLNEDDKNKMEIQKLLFIFFLVFFPEHQVEKRLNIDCEHDCKSFKKSYIEEFKQYEKYKNKRPEFIDAYINNVRSHDLKYFACYTYLNFLFNKVEDDIEFNKNNKNNNSIENEFNTIRDGIKKIIDTFKDRQIFSESNKSTPIPTYSTLYKRINREFIRILDSNKKELQDHNYKYLSGYNAFDRKYFIYLFYNYLIKKNKTKEISEYKFFQLLNLDYYDFLKQFVTLYMKSNTVEEAKKNVNQFFDNIIKEYENYSKFEDYAENVKNNIILSINNQKQLGGNKSRKRKQKTTRKKRRKSNRKHR